jgi:hypothetical protein
MIANYNFLLNMLFFINFSINKNVFNFYKMLNYISKEQIDLELLLISILIN